MGVRVGAWLIDTLILGAFQVGFWAFAAGVGVLAVNPEAERQMQTAPLSLPTVAPYRVNLPLLAVLLSGFVLLNVVYAAVCWARFRATPGQKALSLQVGSAASGRNLTLGRALARAVIAVGTPIGAVAGIFYAVFAFETVVPWSDVLNPQTGGPADQWISRWSGLLLLALVAGVAWPALLLVWTATSSTRQGPHDRLADSLVVGRDARFQGAHGRPPAAWMPGALPPGGSPGPAPAVAATETAPGSVDESGPGRADPKGPEPGMPGVAGWGPVTPRTGSDAGAQPTFHPVTVGRRIAAYLFDCVFVYLIYALSASVIEAALLPSTGATTIDERTYILMGLVGGLEQLVYFVSGWVLVQGTLGQRLMHMRVADATTGRSLTWMDGVVRWAVLQGPFALVTIAPNAIRTVVLALAAGWSLYLLYTILFRPDEPALHDRFLNTRVRLDL
jgi:uncharacterized RDD family membrane protein YckC